SGDVDAIWRVRRIPSVFEWLGHDFSDRDRFGELMADPARLTTTLVLEQDGEVVGDLYLQVTDAWAQSDVAEQARRTVAEIGWVLDPARAGQGLATEAARELL